MSIEFQWDKEKALQNLKKHGVTFEEAATTLLRYPVDHHSGQ